VTIPHGDERVSALSEGETGGAVAAVVQRVGRNEKGERNSGAGNEAGMPLLGDWVILAAAWFATSPPDADDL
jgi:hypothetical protein